MERTDEEIKRTAYLTMEGIAKWWREYLILLLIVLAILAVGPQIFGWSMDATDKSSWTRSGMSLHTDYETGVQYLSSGGGLIVRVDANGKPMVIGRK